MVLMGAGGRTKSQLEEVLGTGLETTRTGYGDINRRLLDGFDGERNFDGANRIYVAKGFTPKQLYQEILNNTFLSDVEEKDFASQASQSVQEVIAHCSVIWYILNIVYYIY